LVVVVLEGEGDSLPRSNCKQRKRSWSTYPEAEASRYRAIAALRSTLLTALLSMDLLSAVLLITDLLSTALLTGLPLTPLLSTYLLLDLPSALDELALATHAHIAPFHWTVGELKPRLRARLRVDLQTSRWLDVGMVRCSRFLCEIQTPDDDVLKIFGKTKCGSKIGPLLVLRWAINCTILALVCNECLQTPPDILTHLLSAFCDRAPGALISPCQGPKTFYSAVSNDRETTAFASICD
jgi:hypothetical protein